MRPVSIASSTRDSRPVARSHAKYAFAALALGLVAPSQLILPIDSARITVTRAVLLVLVIPALLTFLRGLGGGDRRIQVADVFAALMCFWILLALTVTEGIAVSADSGMLVVLEFLGAYLIMRAFVRTRRDVEAYVSCLTAAILFLCLLYTSPSPRDGLLSRMPSSA